MMCLDDGLATRVKRGIGGGSGPDVTIIHGSRLAGCEWSVADRLGSDHSAVIVEVECGGVGRLGRLEAVRRTWRWKAADWPAFAEQIEDILQREWSDYRLATLDARVRFLKATILNAARSYIGEAKVSPRERP